MKTLFFLPAQSVLRINAFEIRVSQAKAMWFFEALVNAAHQANGLTSAELALAWKRRNLGSAPTRTDMTRMLRALQAGLAQLAFDSGEEIDISIAHAPRQATTGPWRLVVGAGWQVTVLNVAGKSDTNDGQSSASHLLLPLSSIACPLVWVRIAQHSARVDSLINEGYYVDALALLNLPPDVQLSSQMRLVQGLRKARILRRLGRYVEAAKVLAELLNALNESDLDWRMQAFVQAQHDLMVARTSFDEQPAAASLSTKFDRLRETLDCAPNPALQWEWCNFKALALRRKLDAVAGSHACKPQQNLQIECEELAHKIQALFASAYVWATLAHDMYAAQAIAINLAYNLQIHIQRRISGATAGSAQSDFSPCLAWYALAHSLVDQFSLPQDSAWDFIMLGELVLRQPAARQRLASDTAAWPESISPLQIGFYERSIELAGQFGSMRQKVEANNQMVQFLKLLAQANTGFVMPAIAIPERNQKISALRQQMGDWLQERPESAADMAREGFVMQ